MMTQGASCDYMTVAEAEEIEEKKKLAVDILAGVGIIALTIVNPVRCSSSRCIYRLFSSQCNHRKKYYNWKKAI